MKNPFKILVLLYNNFSSDSRVLKECTTLVEAGYQVELWAFYDPNLPEQETINGFVVKRKLLIGKSKIQNIKQWIKKTGTGILGYVEVVVERTPVVGPKLKKVFNSSRSFSGMWIRTALSKSRIKHAIESDKDQKFDFHVLHCHDLQPLELGVKIKKQYPHLKIVYDSHEFQTETPNLNAFLPAKAYAQKLERDCIAYANEVISVSPDIAAQYVNMYNLKTVHLIRNCPPLSKVRHPNTNYFRKHFKLKNDSIVFLYQGALKASRGVEEVLNCFSSLWKKEHHSKHIVFMGYGPLETSIQQRSKDCSNIHFHPSINMYDLPKVSNSADYGIIFTPNTCKNHEYSLPNKLFEYMAFELPIITSPLKTLKELVEQEQIGIVTKGFATDDLLDSIQNISAPANQQLKDHLWKLHNEKYNWDIEKQTLLKIYSNLSEP